MALYRTGKRGAAGGLHPAPGEAFKIDEYVNASMQTISLVSFSGSDTIITTGNSYGALLINADGYSSVTLAGTINGSIVTQFLDENMLTIGGIGGGGARTDTIPANTKYVWISLHSTAAGTVNISLS